MLSVIIVGVNGWEQYTRPLVADIWKWHPDMELVVIDNGSKEPYPTAPHIHRIPEMVCYSAAINKGVEIASNSWILLLNNDVRCNGSFEDAVKGLDDKTLYARQIITEKGHVWFGAWLLLMSRKSYSMIGGWDENFQMAGFDDTDFAVRAKAIGIETKPIDLPFTHLWGRTRWITPGYPEARLRNIDYFEKKHGWRPGDDMQVIHD